MLSIPGSAYTKDISTAENLAPYKCLILNFSTPPELGDDVNYLGLQFLYNFATTFDYDSASISV